MCPTGKSTHLISDGEMGNLFRQLDKNESKGLENYVIPLGIRLQFEFADRRSEIIAREWDRVDLRNRRKTIAGVPLEAPVTRAACPCRWVW